MTLSEVYRSIVKFGLDKDPRKRAVKNPFADSAVLFGSPGTQIRKVMVGIDIDVADLLLADRIRKEQGLDLVLSHHPSGQALAQLNEVMQLQVDVFTGLGISQKLAQEMMDERKREVERRLLPANHMRTVDAARLLKMPFMCVHTPADNHVYSYLTAIMRKQKPRKVGDIVDILMKMPEYKDAASYAMGPRVILGSPSRPAGKISVDMTGGTEGPKEIFDKMYKAGVRTLVCMHLSEEHFAKARSAGLNLVIAGHISSDTLGLNLILDRLERKQKLDIISCSGFRRVER